MKAYRNLAMICSFFLLLFIGSLGYVIGLNNGINTQIVPTENVRAYIPYQEASTNQLNTIIEQCTDKRGLISVSFVKDGKEWAFDYLTKHEYDSAFHNYVNYKQ